ncbi:MliC family protein [Sphingomonas psychrotolerans]|uniref:MliC family protein n=1 Tax=Sphingomonas psychrotolerans TaxID=1327635 RepID=A0ABU3N5P9_9SPHN|nr:MliC family protein [Sphingomonas psychrotolerans]MDT8759844.1 MliC family protein [Sphingomonas psychrotolerans]
MRLSLPLLLTLAACSSQPAENVVSAADEFDPAPVEQTTPAAKPQPAPSATPAPLDPPAPGEPGGLDNDMTPVSEAPFTEGSAQGAANVVQTYYALLEAGKYGQAYRLWEPGAAGMDGRAFAASFARYSEYHANIGAPGRVDAGAGQRYVTVPVQVYGRLKEGARPFNMRGSVTLHRAGDIDGATPEQRRWRIRSTDIKPRPAEATPTPQATEDNRSTARYRCMDGSRLVARFDPDNDRVTVSRGGKALATLRGDRVASGIRYVAKGYELRAKGSDMTFTAPGQPPIACTAIR